MIGIMLQVLLGVPALAIYIFGYSDRFKKRPGRGLAVRYVGIALYLISGLVTMFPTTILVTTFFACIWILGSHFEYNHFS